MRPFAPRKATAFTLVEIMIVVLIIGILLNIALPNFLQARETSRARACVGSLKQIDAAKQECAMDNKISGADTTSTFDITGTTTSWTASPYSLVDKTGVNGYLRSVPACPSRGVYTTGNVGATPSCSVAGLGGAYAAGQKWYHGL